MCVAALSRCILVPSVHRKGLQWTGGGDGTLRLVVWRQTRGQWRSLHCILTVCDHQAAGGLGPESGGVIWRSEEFLECEGGKQRGPTFTFVVNLHLKWNQILSATAVLACAITAIQIFSMHVYCPSFMSKSVKTMQNIYIITCLCNFISFFLYIYTSLPQ